MKKLSALLLLLFVAIWGTTAKAVTTTFVVNNQTSWTNLYVYAWGTAGNDLLGAWPGQNISGQTSFTITGNYDGVYENLIFNNITTQVPDIHVILKDTTYHITVTNNGATGGVDPEEYQEEDFFAVGDYCQWQFESAVQFTEVEEGYYTVHLDTLFGGLKITSIRAWTRPDYGAASPNDTIGVGDSYALVSNQDGHSNYDLMLNGTYTDVTLALSVTDDMHELSFVSGTWLRDDYYIIGNYCGWDAPQAVMMEYTEEGIYTAHLDSFFGGIKIVTRHFWDGTIYVGQQLYDTIAVGETYTMVVDTHTIAGPNLNTWHYYTDVTFTVEPVGRDLNLTFVSGTQHSFEGRDFFYMIDVPNGIEAQRFDYSDGIYTLQVETLNTFVLLSPFDPTIGTLGYYNIGYGPGLDESRKMVLGEEFVTHPSTEGDGKGLTTITTYLNATLTMVLVNDIPHITITAGHDINEKLVTTEAKHGTVTPGGYYYVGTEIILEATPDEGFAFQLWSDGETANPRSLVVTQDTTIRALFYMPEVEQEITVDSITSNSITITWTAVEEASLYELTIYKHGQTVATYYIDADNNIINTLWNSPERIIARKDSTGGSSETLQVKITGLESGQGYTYTLDALDESSDFVGSQSGSFTTEEAQTYLPETIETRKKETCCRKMLRNGRLIILAPDGKTYDARGAAINDSFEQ